MMGVSFNLFGFDICRYLPEGSSTREEVGRFKGV